MLRRSRRASIALATVSFAATVAAAGVLANGVSAQAAPLVTDYDAYPAPEVAGAPEGCDGGSFNDASFSTGDGDQSADLQSLPSLQAGDEVTFSWTGLGPGCTDAEANVTLVVMSSPSESFDPSDTQRAVAYETVGGEAGEVTLVMPSLVDEGDDCRYHLNAVMGYALAEVGPNGSYYSASSRGDDERSMLASSRIGRYASCIETVTTSTTSTTITPSTLPDTDPPPVVTTLVALPTIVPPPTTTTAPLLDVSAEDLAAPPPARAQPSIPATGADIGGTLALGLIALALGTGLLALVALKFERRVEPR
jgi:hypothetical protein